MSEALTHEDCPRDLTYDEEMSALGDDDRVEMTNLHERHTGLPGVIFISSRIPAHGPRVKFYLKSGKDSASCSISVSAEPRVVASSLPRRDLDRATPPVLAWVSRNHDSLLRFWNEGEDFTPEDLASFVASLEKV